MSNLFAGLMFLTSTAFWVLLVMLVIKAIKKKPKKKLGISLAVCGMLSFAFMIAMVVTDDGQRRREKVEPEATKVQEFTTQDEHARIITNIQDVFELDEHHAVQLYGELQSVGIVLIDSIELDEIDEEYELWYAMVSTPDYDFLVSVTNNELFSVYLGREILYAAKQGGLIKTVDSYLAQTIAMTAIALATTTEPTMKVMTSAATIITTTRLAATIPVTTTRATTTSKQTTTTKPTTVTTTTTTTRTTTTTKQTAASISGQTSYTFKRNSDATISVKGSPNTKYYIDVHYPSGISTAAGLESKISSSSGNVSWTWQIGGRTTIGNHYAIIRDDTGNKLRVEFTVIESD